MPDAMTGRVAPRTVSWARVRAPYLWLLAPAPLAAAAALASLGGVGCASIPPGRAEVASVDVRGTHAVDPGDVEEKIATTPSPKLLGLWSGVVFDYELFDRYVLQRDLERVERFYRARGFYEAHARAGRVQQKGDHVRVTIVVEEGPDVRVRSVEVRGLDGLPRRVADAARRAADANVPKGERFDEDRYARAQADVRGALTDRGYAWAKVTRNAQVDLLAHRADVVFDVQPDKPSVFGPIRLEGLGALPEAPVLRALDIDEGAPFSTAALQRAQQAALDLGVFTSVEIAPETPEPPPNDRVVPLTVRVQPTRLYGVLAGGGVELDSLKTEAHLIGGWEARNFLGGMRFFSVRAKPGLVLYPTRLPDLEKPTNVLLEGRLQTELRQPGFIESRTSGLVRLEASQYPLLLATRVEPDEPVIGYREVRATAGVDRTLWKLYLFPSYDAQINYPFAYKGQQDPALTHLLISYVELLARLDLRDDPVHPRKGLYVGADVQYAGLGGDARDVRVQPDVRAYWPLLKRVAIAVRGTVGFLFPQNYGDYAGEPFGPANDAARSAWSRDIQIGYFRGFFSGGPSSNRGYPLRGVGPHGIVPFFSPGIAAQALAKECDPGSPLFDPVRCSIPLGGASMWEASAEVRAGISGPVSSAFFCDAGDVSPLRVNLRFDRLHLSCGAGLRYDTPVGPIRLDVGWRIPGLQTAPGVNPVSEGDPGRILGLPIAIALGIGEAF
jgi:outer membrane protein insertion porin family/translocation and assembly module TamA